MGEKFKPLNLEERTMIQTQLSMGLKPGRIARELVVSFNTQSGIEAQRLNSDDAARCVGRPG
jgi:BarA-like signal transduction histidine kinase